MNVERRNAYRLLVRKSEGKGPLGRPKNRWANNIKMNFGEIVCGGMAQDRDQWKAVANEVMNLRVPKILGNP
jgi:hypothetical protein